MPGRKSFSMLQFSRLTRRSHLEKYRRRLKFLRMRQEMSITGTDVFSGERDMPRYDIQFQKGLSLREFMARYGAEEQCIEAICKARWPNGFQCPECGSTRHRPSAPPRLHRRDPWSLPRRW
jgi:hypothetical protein